MTNVRGITGILALLIVVGGITSVVMRPNSSNVINALGNAFTGALRTSMGR